MSQFSFSSTSTHTYFSLFPFSFYLFYFYSALYIFFYQNLFLVVFVIVNDTCFFTHNFLHFYYCENIWFFWTQMQQEYKLGLIQLMV